MNLAALGEQWHGLRQGGRELRLPAPRDRRGHGAGAQRRAVPREQRRCRRGRATCRWPGPTSGTPSSRRRGALDAAGSAAGVVADRADAGDGAAAHREEASSTRPARAIGRRTASWSTRRPAGSRWRSPPSSAVVDPELVILGGGIGGNADLLLEPVRARASRTLAVPATDRGLDPGGGGDPARRGLDGPAGGAGPAVRTRGKVSGVNPETPMGHVVDGGRRWVQRHPGSARGGRRTMKRWLVAIATLALVAAACTAGGDDDDRRRSTPARARRTSRSRSRCGARGRRRQSSRTSTRSSPRSRSSTPGSP